MSLPQGWALAPLSELVVTRVAQGEPGETPVNYIDIGSIDRGTKRIGPTEKVTGATAPTRARQWVRKGDVLVSMTRPNLNAVAIVGPDLDGAVASTGFDVLRADGIIPEWIFNRVRSQAFVADVCEGVQGVVYPAVRPDDVRQHMLPVPPRAEQARILEALDSYLSRLDASVDALVRAEGKLRAYRASVLKAAAEGRLVPTEASLARAEKRTYEPAEILLKRILAERRRRWEENELSRLAAAGKAPKNDKWKEKYKEPAGPNPTGMPSLPTGWCWARAETFFWDAGYGTSEKCSQEPNGPPVLRIPNVVNGHISLADMKYAGTTEGLAADGWVAPGDFIFIRTNGSKSLIGRGALVVDDYEHKHYFASYLIRLRLVRVGPAPEWFALAWHSPAVRDQVLHVAASSAGQHNVSLSSAADFFVPLPPAAEQARILAEVARVLSASEAVEADVSKDVRRCARLRQTILKWAFEGKLVDQDPRDEPATKLLQRIRDERAAATPPRKPRARKQKATS